MNSDDAYQDYLRDLGQLIKEMAFEAKVKAKASGSPFDTGYLAGFHRVVSLMQQQAEAFGIPVEQVGLGGIDADEDWQGLWPVWKQAFGARAPESVLDA